MTHERAPSSAAVDRAGEVYSQIAMLRGHLRSTLRPAAAAYRSGVDDVLLVLVMSARVGVSANGLAALSGLTRSEVSSRLWALADEGVVEQDAVHEAGDGHGEAGWRLSELGVTLVRQVSGPDLWLGVAEELRVVPRAELEALLVSLEELSRRLLLPVPSAETLEVAIEELGAELERGRRLGTLVERLYRTIRAEHSRQLSAESGGVIDSAAYMVLDLSRRTGMSAERACEALGVSHGRLMEIAEPLVRRGYLLRRRSQENVRDVALETTPAGHLTIDVLQPFAPDAALPEALATHSDPDGLRRRLGTVVRAIGRCELVADALRLRLVSAGAGAARVASPPPLVDPLELRAVMGEFATGVALVTVRTPSGARAVTVNSFTSVSLEPVLVLVCLVRERPAVHAILEAGAFGVNVLPVGQKALAGRFGRAEGPGNSHSLEGVDWSLEAGMPRIGSAIAWLGCSLDRLIDAGDHVIVLGAPIAAEATAPGADARTGPLIFWRGGYGSLHEDDPADAG